MNCIWNRLENESDEELIYRICSQKDIIGTWDNVADILNKILNKDYKESKYRKQYQAFKKMLDANQSKIIDGDAYIKEIEVAKRELEREKIKFRDERNAWNKQNYIDARVEQKLDFLENELKKQGKINFNINENVKFNSDNDILVILSDLHIGQFFKSKWGEYNTDIAKHRIEKLLNEIISIQKLHNSENCFVSIQGDIISGNIHKTIQVTNRENIIEQIKIATELISSFCYQLTKYFNNVYMSNVCGNHSRLDRKEDSLHDERLDDIISWAVELSLKHIDNFHVNKENIDNGIVELNIRNKKYIAVHGDFDAYNKQGVSNLCMMLGYIPYAVTFGHLHTCALDEVNGVKMIRGGSLAGSGCDYTIEKRLSGSPSQMVCVCDKNGLKCFYPIILN